MQYIVLYWTAHGSNLSRGWDLPYLHRLDPRSIQPPVKWVPSVFPGTKQPARGINHLPPFRAQIKVQLYLYLQSGP
jgi:hypothetical protein